LANRETFYNAFYGFKSSPFHVTPDPDNILLTEAHKDAIGAIYYGIIARKGFVVVTGEVGVGKTSVLRATLDRLDAASTKIVYLFNPRLTPTELYSAILADLGDGRKNRRDVLASLQHLLLKLYNSGLNVVLAIDEAQNMPEETLEDLRVLSNLETRSDKLLQIVLVGQPELDATLGKSSLRQLQQRIAVRATIPELGLKQSFRYVRHRLAAAGRADDNPLFSLAALSYIAYAADGNPRRLNVFCDNALINGLGHRAERVTLPIAREALRPFKKSLRAHPRPLGWIAAFAALAVLSAFGLTTLRSSVKAWLGQSSEGRIAANSAPAPVAEPAATMPTNKAAAPATDPPSLEPVASHAPAANDVPAAAPLASGTTEARVRVTSSPEESAPVVTSKLELVGEPEPIYTGVTARTDDDAPLRSDGGVDVVVRPGNSLLQLCRSIYGRCDSTTLRLVLKTNPQIRSARLIVSGDTVVFPPRRPTGTHSDKD
jgi:general secretion pathway protein A